MYSKDFIDYQLDGCRFNPWLRKSAGLAALISCDTAKQYYCMWMTIF